MDCPSNRQHLRHCLHPFARRLKHELRFIDDLLVPHRLVPTTNANAFPKGNMLKGMCQKKAFGEEARYAPTARPCVASVL